MTGPVTTPDIIAMPLAMADAVRLREATDAAFRAGAEAMREMAAEVCMIEPEAPSTMLNHAVTKWLNAVARSIRNLPLPTQPTSTGDVP